MIRTQIYLPVALHRQLQHVAAQRGLSMAELTRVFIARGLGEAGQREAEGKRTIERLLAVQASGGPPDLSKNIDHYLYGDSKRGSKA